MGFFSARVKNDIKLVISNSERFFGSSISPYIEYWLAQGMQGDMRRVLPFPLHALLACVVRDYCSAGCHPPILLMNPGLPNHYIPYATRNSNQLMANSFCISHASNPIYHQTLATYAYCSMWNPPIQYTIRSVQRTSPLLTSQPPPSQLPIQCSLPLHAAVFGTSLEPLAPLPAPHLCSWPHSTPFLPHQRSQDPCNLATARYHVQGSSTRRVKSGRSPQDIDSSSNLSNLSNATPSQ